MFVLFNSKSEKNMTDKKSVNRSILLVYKTFNLVQGQIRNRQKPIFMFAVIVCLNFLKLIKHVGEYPFTKVKFNAS